MTPSVMNYKSNKYCFCWSIALLSNYVLHLRAFGLLNINLPPLISRHSPTTNLSGNEYKYHSGLMIPKYGLLIQKYKLENIPRCSSILQAQSRGNSNRVWGQDRYILEKNSNRNSKIQGQTTSLQALTAGLSKIHQGILSTNTKVQCCVTGHYPLRIVIKENPTRKWLGSSSVAFSQMFVNGTRADRSLASYDRYQWLDEKERTNLQKNNALFSLKFLGEINVKKPGYVNILPANAAGAAAEKRREDKDRGFLNLLKGGNVLDDSGEENGQRQEHNKERLWVTGFSMTENSGEMNYVDVETGNMGNVNGRTAGECRWPNEVNSVPTDGYRPPSALSSQLDSHVRKKPPTESKFDDSLLVSDGFLVPGRDNGGLYIVSKPGHSEAEWSVCLTGESSGEGGWFYHRSIWVDLTGDGRKSILTARAKRPSIMTLVNGGEIKSSIPHETQLVWLERPQPYRYDDATGTPLDRNGLKFDPFSSFNTPWKVRVLDNGPDVMFSVADLDTTDDTIEVIASQFFNRKLTLHSIKVGPEPKVVLRRTLEDQCGASFSSILANLNPPSEVNNSRMVVVDSGSTVQTLKSGDLFSHILVTTHECTSPDNDLKIKMNSFERSNGYKKSFSDHTKLRSDTELLNDISSTNMSPKSSINGGSLLSFKVPPGKDAWKTEPWIRSVVATGFQVRAQLGSMINPGAPGFCYTFYPTSNVPKIGEHWTRPLIGISGDCSEAAYILRPDDKETGKDPSANYAMMCEIDCGATVGSIGIGYKDFCFEEQQSNYAKIYIPCYEKDKVLVFALGKGESDGM